MGDPEHSELWNMLNSVRVDLAGLGQRVTSISDRATGNEARVGVIETWRIEQEKHAERMTGEVASLRESLMKDIGALRDAMAGLVVSEKSRWDKVWDVVQPIILAVILLILGLKGFHL